MADQFMRQLATLYIIPTPIGHLEDISHRALKTLTDVDLIVAEDTRHTGVLLHHFGIRNQITSLHEHNERRKTNELISQLQAGVTMALVSDAGTPLINDPGFRLVRGCRASGIPVVPLPGPCAAITALSAAGLPTNRFCFEGFLPAKQGERCQVLQLALQEPRTLIFYVSPHRIIDSVRDIIVVMGSDRQLVLARELTKRWEQIQGGTAAAMLQWLEEDPWHSRGEMVLLLEGCQADDEQLSAASLRTLVILMSELPLKRAAALTAMLHQANKNELYRYGLQLANSSAGIG